MKKVPVLTIDGPSASGKGTVGREIARRLGWHFLDSGALYRALAYRALKEGIDLEDPKGLAELARRLEVAWGPGGEVLVHGEPAELGSEEIGRAASKVAAYPEVREALLERQRRFKRPPGLVADGRDMGTVVFPEAPYKVFLTASVEERARRRYLQLRQKGVDVNLEIIKQEIEARDVRDRNRPVAPLRPACDALIIDSTGLSVKQLVERILNFFSLRPSRGRKQEVEARDARIETDRSLR